MDGNGRIEVALEVGHAEGGVGVTDLRQHGGGHTEGIAQLLAPRQTGDVEELGARGVGVVRPVGGPSRQAIQEVGVHGAQAQLPPGQRMGGGGHVLQEPREFGGREVGRELYARLHAHELGHALATQPFAHVLGARVLPDDGACKWRAIDVPHERRLTLVGDAHATDVSLVDGGLCHDVGHGGEHVGVDLLRIVLDPASVAHDLSVRPVGAGHERPLPIKEQRLGSLRALVDAKNVRGHGAFLPCPFPVTRHGACLSGRVRHPGGATIA